MRNLPAKLRRQGKSGGISPSPRMAFVLRTCLYRRQGSNPSGSSVASQDEGDQEKLRVLRGGSSDSPPPTMG